MRALLLISNIEDESISPQNTRVLCIDNEGKLVTVVISKSLSSKWKTDISQASTQSGERCALVDFTFEGKVSQSHIVNITKEESEILKEIPAFAFNLLDSSSSERIIPENMLKVTSQIIENATKFIEKNKEYFIEKENRLSNVIGRNGLLNLEKKGIFINDITDKSSLALCIWKMPVQIENRNLFPILLFNEENKLIVYVPELEPTVNNAKEAVSHLFDFSDPFKLSFEKPRITLKEIIGGLNPLDLFNPKYIPSSAVLPRNNDDIYLCLDTSADSLTLGIITVNLKPARAIIDSNEKLNKLVTELIGSICFRFLSGKPIQEHYISVLNTLLYCTTGQGNIKDLDIFS